MAICIISIILILFALILFAPIEVKILYHDDLSVSVQALGIKIPLDKEKKKDKKKKTESTNEEKAEKSLLDILTFKEKLELAKSLLSRFLKYSRKKIQIKKLDVKIEYGTDDAAKTAILVGAFWAALYGALPVLDKIFHVRNHQFSVIPLYNRKAFLIKAEGIIRTRCVHIIFIGTILAVQFMKYINRKKAVLNNE